MADPQQNNEQQRTWPAPSSGENDHPPIASTPIPTRIPNIRRLFLALLGLVLLLSTGAGGIWLYRAQHIQQQTYHATSRGTATLPPELGTAQFFPCASGQLVVSGSSTLQPVVARVARDYTARCSQASFTVQDGGSRTGLAQLEAGMTGIVMTDLPVSPTQADLVDHPLVVVIFGVIVNVDVGLTNLTTAQLQDIYTGTYTNWRQVGGPNLPIVLLPGSSLVPSRAIFEQYVLGQYENIGYHLPPIPDLGDAVSNTAGAIGYVPVSQVPDHDKVRIIAINGSQPTFSNVEDNTYPFWNVEHLYTKGRPTALEQALLDFIESNSGQFDEGALFCLPRSAIQPSALSAHNATPKPA